MNYIRLNRTGHYVHPDMNATSTHGAMTVGELRAALEEYDDEAVVLIDNGSWTDFGLDYVEEAEAQNYERDFDDCAWDEDKIERHSKEG